MKASDLNHLGSLLTYGAGDNETCVGYLMDFGEHGIHEPTHGRIDGLTKEQADTHNRLLGEGEVKGLDENCQIGQGGTFYFDGKTLEVRTWIGTVVSKHVTVTGKSIRFERRGKVFVGRLRKDADCFNFKRIV